MDYERLLYELEEKLLKEPSDTLVMNKLAIANMENRNYEKAYELFEKASIINPSVETLTNLGWFCFNEGIPIEKGTHRYADEDALKILERAIEFHPKSHFTYSVLGEVYLKTQKFTKAEKILRESVSIKADLSNQNNLGVALYKQNMMEEALYWFRKACKETRKERNNAQIYVNYGCTLAILNMMTEAENVANILKELDEDNMCPADIAQIYYLIENYEEVVSLYQKCKYNFSIELLQFYLYALKMSGEEMVAYELINKSIENNKIQIEEYKQDEEIDKSEHKELINYNETEIYQWKELMKDLEKGIKPNLNFVPYIENRCYLFGCFRHNNPDLDL